MNATPPPEQASPAPAETSAIPAAIVRTLTLVGAELAFAGLFAYVIYETWKAASGHPPSIPQPIESASGALAVAFGAGYAAVLGIQQPGGGVAFFAAFTKRERFKRFLTTQAVLVIGALLYMAVGAAVCVTYVANTGETPGLVRTVAIGFGGYVIAYLGVAYRVWMQ